MKTKEQLLAEKQILVDALELQKKKHGDPSRWHRGWDFLFSDIKQYDKELKELEDDKYKDALTSISKLSSKYPTKTSYLFKEHAKEYANAVDEILDEVGIRNV